MPFIEIKGCGECPHCVVNNYAIEGVSTSPDTCAIKCGHPEQDSNTYIEVRIRSVDHVIYFRCPLEKDESYD